MENAEPKNVKVPRKSCTQSVVIDGLGEYVYFMTNNTFDLRRKLKNMGYRIPEAQDWRYNPALHQNVRDKMAELGTQYSLTTSHNVAILNFYVPNDNPFIVYLSDLREWRDDEQKLYDSLNIPDMPPLLYVCATGNVHGVRLFLEHKVDVNVQDENGYTALMIASARNHPEIVWLLLQNGADVSLRANNGGYALVFAMLSGAKDVVNMLKESGAKFLSLPLNSAVDKNNVPFNEKLSYYVLNNIEYKYGKNFAPIYKRGGISRKLFSKIWGSRKPDHHPRKNTVLKLAIGLQLTVAQTKDLLKSAGYFLMPDDAFDAIVAGFISRQVYDIHKIERKLFEETGKTLCSYK